ncbi:MAG: outer membrane lipoprotein carrier protein LolA [Pseudomonadota bacterium]
MLKRVMVMLVVMLAPLHTEAEQLSLAEISGYLNRMTTAQANFRQINDDGSVSTGKLYIWRPGRMRFEYDAPNDALVIAEARAVKIIDRKSNQLPETYPLNQTPLALILGRDIDLNQDRMVVGHSFDGDGTIVTAQDPRNPDIGTIQMRFSDSPVALQDWTIEDAAGGRTRIILSELRTGMTLPLGLFVSSRETRDR